MLVPIHGQIRGVKILLYFTYFFIFLANCLLRIAAYFLKCKYILWSVYGLYIFTHLSITIALRNQCSYHVVHITIQLEYLKGFRHTRWSFSDDIVENSLLISRYQQIGNFLFFHWDFFKIGPSQCHLFR